MSTVGRIVGISCGVHSGCEQLSYPSNIERGPGYLEVPCGLSIVAYTGDSVIHRPLFGILRFNDSSTLTAAFMNGRVTSLFIEPSPVRGSVIIDSRQIHSVHKRRQVVAAEGIPQLLCVREPAFRA